MVTLKPISIDKSRLANLQKAFAKQTVGGGGYNPSNDPEHFPVFRTPTQGRYLVYIPNHADMVMDETGEEIKVLRADNLNIHRVLDGSNRFGLQVRCSQGIIDPESGFDGSCPLCEAAQESWEWYNTRIAYMEHKSGQVIKGIDTKEARQLRTNVLNQKPVSNAQARIVFPAVVIETVDKGRRLEPAVDPATGSPKYKVYWINFSVLQYEKITKQVELTEDQSPAGRMFLFNYNYDTKGKEPDAASAGRNMTVTLINPDEKGLIVGFSKDNLLQFDKMTEGWTPVEAMSTVKDAAPRTVEELRSITEEVMPLYRTQTRDVMDSLGIDAQGNPVGIVEASPAAPAIEKSASAPAEPEPVEAEVIDDTVDEGDSFAGDGDVSSIIGNGGFSLSM